MIEDDEYWAEGWRVDGDDGESRAPDAMRRATQTIVDRLGLREARHPGDWCADRFTEACGASREDGDVRVVGTRGLQRRKSFDPPRTSFVDGKRRIATDLLPPGSGYTIFPGTEVTRVLFDDFDDDDGFDDDDEGFRGGRECRAVAVVCEGRSGLLLLRAQRGFVVAAGAEASALLLFRSGLSARRDGDTCFDGGRGDAGGARTREDSHKRCVRAAAAAAE
mmetsp:Transcript_17491/g.56746  ORF Transcript_17491/g.56746 Transcript_17491/m.56746 type:complete len:221 (-) Transcript_17491:171-833(-)